MSQNYDVASQNARAEVTSYGADLYKSPFMDKGEATYIWGERPRSLNDILQEETLPIVVKLCTDNVVKDTETPVDLQRPLLLYKEIKGKKLHARNLKTRAAMKDTNRVMYQPTGPYVTFPDQFQGYFKVLESRDQPLVAVADVGRLMPSSFISTGPCEGFSCLSPIGETLYQKTSLPAGLYHPTNILEENITYVNSKKAQKKKLVRCLKCQDEKGKTVLFPLAVKTSFYISQPSTKFSKHINVSEGCRVHKWTDYDPTKIKGLKVRMMHGVVPQQECEFTGLLEFCHMTKEHTVIGSTMTSSPRLFEMAVTSEPFFIVALNSDNSDNYGTLHQKCLKFARNECESYMQAIKVKRDYDIDQADRLH